MIKEVRIVNNLGEMIKVVLEEAEPDHGLLLTKMEGIGPSSANVNRTDLATRDGSKKNSAKINERNIVLTFTLTGSDIETVRQTCYKYLPPKKDIFLQIKSHNRFVGIDGCVESNEPDIFSDAVEQQVSIICPDPYFRALSPGSDGEYVSEVNVFSGIEKMFYLPFPTESLPEGEDTIYFGNIVNTRDNKYVNYSGDSDTGFVIYIHALGDVPNDLTIYDITLSGYITLYKTKIENLTGSYILENDEIYISTKVGEKYVVLLRNGVEYNILDSINYDSITWFQLVPGTNAFSYVAGDYDHNLEFEIYSEILYNGV